MADLRTGKEVLTDNELLSRILENIERQVNSDDRNLGTLKFFNREIGEAGVESVVEVAHGLPFTPLDIWITGYTVIDSEERAPEVLHSRTDSDNIYIRTFGRVQARFYAGRLSSRERSAVSRTLEQGTINPELLGEALPQPGPLGDTTFERELRFSGSGEAIFFSSEAYRTNAISMNERFGSVPRRILNEDTGDRYLCYSDEDLGEVLYNNEDLGIVEISGDPWDDSTKEDLATVEEVAVPSLARAERVPYFDCVASRARRTRQTTPWEKFYLQRYDDSESLSGSTSRRVYRRTGIEIWGLSRDTKEWEFIRRIIPGGKYPSYIHCPHSALFSQKGYLYGFYQETIYETELSILYKFDELFSLSLGESRDPFWLSRIDSQGRFSLRERPRSPDDSPEGNLAFQGLVGGERAYQIGDGGILTPIVSELYEELNPFEIENYAFGYWGDDYCLFYANPSVGDLKVWRVLQGSYELLFEKNYEVPPETLNGVKSRGVIDLLTDGRMLFSFNATRGGFSGSAVAIEKDGTELRGNFRMQLPVVLFKELRDNQQDGKQYISLISGFIQEI